MRHKLPSAAVVVIIQDIQVCRIYTMLKCNLISVDVW